VSAVQLSVGGLRQTAFLILAVEAPRTEMTHNPLYDVLEVKSVAKGSFV
jgi:hypothetical protein